MRSAKSTDSISSFPTEAFKEVRKEILPSVWRWGHSSQVCVFVCVCVCVCVCACVSVCVHGCICSTHSIVTIFCSRSSDGRGTHIISLVSEPQKRVCGVGCVWLCPYLSASRFLLLASCWALAWEDP